MYCYSGIWLIGISHLKSAASTSAAVTRYASGSSFISSIHVFGVISHSFRDFSESRIRDFSESRIKDSAGIVGSGVISYLNGLKD